jgi:hypothetical protein
MIAESKLKKFVTQTSESEISVEQKNENQNLSTSTRMQKTVSEFAVIVSMKELNASLNFVHY